MRVVVSLLNATAYPVRFQVFLALSNHVSHVSILTNELDDALRLAASEYPRVSVHELGHTDFPSSSVAWLSAYVARESEPTVIHSTFGHLVHFFERCGRIDTRHFRLVHTQYTANHDWFRSTRFQDFPMSYKYLGQRIKSFWNDRRMANAADAVFVVCPGHVDSVREVHRTRSTAVYAVPSEVDAVFYQNPQPRRLCPRKLIFVGACYKNKGLDVLFQALPTIFKDYPELQVELYGRTVERQHAWFMNALTEASRYGRVCMKGSVSPHALRIAFDEADVLVSPSRFEGSPRAVREALAAGCPCILSAIPGHFGLDPEGQYVDFVEGFDPQVWARAITDHLEQTDLRWTEKAEAGAASMLNGHTPKAVSAALFNTYERLF